MSAIMSQNGRKMAKIIHNVAKKFDLVLYEHEEKGSGQLPSKNDSIFQLRSSQISLIGLE